MFHCQPQRRAVARMLLADQRQAVGHRVLPGGAREVRGRVRADRDDTQVVALHGHRRGKTGQWLFAVQLRQAVSHEQPRR